MDILELYIKSFSAIFGLLVGSFLNVVILRVPRNQSIVKPRSSCPKCHKQIKWYENLPLVSYILLRGKCSRCKAKISWRYPLIEALVGLISLFLAPSSLNVEAWLSYIFYFSLACVFLAHFVIDVEHQLLPDKINLFFLIISIPYVLTNFPLYHWLVGGVIGFLGPLGVTYFYYKLRGQLGLGGGDIKFFGILGLILGPVGILNNIFMSCMLGSIVGVVMILSKKLDKDVPFAFGPFIIIVASLQIFFPEVVELISPVGL